MVPVVERETMLIFSLPGHGRSHHAVSDLSPSQLHIKLVMVWTATGSNSLVLVVVGCGSMGNGLTF